MSCIFLIFLCPQPVNDFSSWFLISSSLWLLNYYFSLGSWSETIFLSNLRFLETFSINHFLEAVSFLFPEVPDITVERLYSWSDFTLGLLSFSGSLLPPNRYSRLHFSSFPCGCYLLVPFSLLSYRLTVNLLYLNDGYRGEETPRDRDEERRDPRSNARKPTCWINIVSVSCGSMWYTPCGKEINSWRAYGYISIENAGPPSRKTHMKIR